MKKIKQLIARLLRSGKPAFAALILALLALLTPVSSRAQTIGTYVATRPVVLWSGYLTNGMVTNVYLTNFLNYAGFHRVGFWLSTTITNPVNNLGSNIQVSAKLSPGTGNGYTNAIFGTNLVYTSASVWAWQNTAATNQLVMTNLDWQVVDSVQSFQLTITNSATNVLLQLDGVVTP